MCIPKCTSTQHPDNVFLPFFAEDKVLGGEDEVQEAFYVFSHLGCDEQMWDYEGKEVDSFVVKKLLAKYDNFFREKVLGRDLFLTPRVPNPEVESTEGKVLLETLDSIPRSYDAAKTFYGSTAAPPVFEVILPMTQSAESMNRVYTYYRDFVIEKEEKELCGMKIKEWVGEFKPESIDVIPLFEDRDRLLNCDKIVREYLKDKDLRHMRVFLARSDPAMNYGLISAVLLNKIALSKLYELQEDLKIDIYPIIGVGSAPFRGNLRPYTVDRVVKEYPSVWTFTVQSSFKYDNKPSSVIEGIEKIKKHRVHKPRYIEDYCLNILEKYTRAYEKKIVRIAKYVNKVAQYIPERRRRKLHIGLFGYSRNVEGVKLPRAIGFTAALYSLGLPH